MVCRYLNLKPAVNRQPGYRRGRLVERTNRPNRPGLALPSLLDHLYYSRYLYKLEYSR